MSVRYIDGFEDYATADIFAGNWNYRLGSAAAITIAASGRNAGSCLSCDHVVGDPAALCKVLDDQATWVIGFALNFDAGTIIRGAIITLQDAGIHQVSLYHNTDNTLSVTRGGSAVTGGTSVSALSLNTWYYIEFKVTIADSIGAGTCKVNVNGVTWITVATGQDLKATANATANSVVFGTTVGSVFLSRTVLIDDIYILDGTAGVVAGDNDFLGDVRVDSLLPTADGTTNSWTPSAGDNYAAVDEAAPDGDTTYVSSGTVNQIDTYAMGDLGTTPEKIWAVQTGFVARKEDAGVRTVAPVLRGTDGDKFGTARGVGLDYAAYHEVHEQNPLDTPEDWTETTVNSIEIGVKLIA